MWPTIFHYTLCIGIVFCQCNLRTDMWAFKGNIQSDVMKIRRIKIVFGTSLESCITIKVF